MIKNLTFSVVLLTMIVLTSSSVDAADYFDISSNSHISDNVSYLKGLTPNTSVPETTPEPTPVPAPVQKTKTVKTAPKTNPIATYTVMASAYSSTPDQTDDTPFITAKGTYVRDGIVAANFLPFGTAIKIPEVFGDKIFIVEDRMNKRYRYNVDVWFPSKELAKQFGRKTVRIEVIS